MPEKWDVPSQFGPCSCSQLRRTARKVSALYDAALSPCGLTVTQHAILVNIGRAGSISRTALASRLGMDRTTLTRNLRPLEAKEFVVPAESVDRRERLLILSAEGCRRLRQSYDLWEKAQLTFAEQLTFSATQHLHATLKGAEGAAEAALRSFTHSKVTNKS